MLLNRKGLKAPVNARDTVMLWSRFREGETGFLQQVHDQNICISLPRPLQLGPGRGYLRDSGVGVSMIGSILANLA